MRTLIKFLLAHRHDGEKEEDMKKIFWFSRHQMTPEQQAALGSDVEIHQCSKTIASAYEVAEELAGMDVIAVVAPINLQAQFLKLAGDRPVITAVSERILVPQEDGEDQVVFRFVKWERLISVQVVKEDYIP